MKKGVKIAVIATIALAAISTLLIVVGLVIGKQDELMLKCHDDDFDIDDYDDDENL